ncbi:MAG: riboflavin kinase [Rikenellaceae bacterium]
MVVEGVVVEGRRLGRQLGFPTANIELTGDDPIRSGVYRSRVWIRGVEYAAISNVGTNPTVGEVKRRVESHIFDFSEDIYGMTILVELDEWLRSEMRFESVEALREQIRRDVEMCKCKLL